MLGFFTDPYPDELLYSSCARYAERRRALNRKKSQQEIFGSKSYSAVPDLPTRLGNFVKNLPEGHLYTVDKIIAENTLLNFYRSFLPTERAALIRQEMAGDNDNHIQVRLGLQGKQIRFPDYLRFCPACTENDRFTYTETYWHRIHQLAGVLVCPQHECFLENSFLKWDKKIGYQFFPAEDYVRSAAPRYLIAENRNHNILLKISQGAQWLLSGNAPCLGPEILHERYFNLLLRKGFAYYNGKIKFKKLLQAYHDYFSPELLMMIGQPSDRNDWIPIMLKSDNAAKSYHPVRHLLLMIFLETNAEELFTAFNEFKPFGVPPYPCLNLASDHYREMKIEKCNIFDNVTKDPNKKNRPIAHFKCEECDFIYQRLGPDKGDPDKYIYSSVREYGRCWEEKLTELWANNNLSQREIGSRLGIDQSAVARHAIRLSLPMNTEGTRKIEGYDRHKRPKKSLSERHRQYRNDWLKIRENHPDATRQELIDKESFIYAWLQKNDSDWFESHLPEPHKFIRNSELVDWESADRKLSKEVRTACEEIMGETDYPVRCSITEIINRVGSKNWLEKRAAKLPLTTEVINEFLESWENYMIRKVEWAEAEFREEDEVPTRLQFMVRGRLRNESSKSAKVQQAIDAALNRLYS